MKNLLVAAALFILPTGAWAVCPNPLTVKDAAGATQNISTTNDSSGNCQSNVVTVGAGTAGTANASPVTVQGIAGMTKILVTPDSVALPANQSVNNAQVNGVTPLMGNGVSGTGSQRVNIASDNTPFPTKIDQTTPGTTNGVVVNSSVLPTGGATSANQSTEIGSLATIATNSGSAIPAGTNLIGKVGIDQTTPGTTNAVTQTPQTPTVSDAATSLVLKASATQSIGIVSAHAENYSSTSGFLIVYNATAAPGTGALTASLILACQRLPGNGSADVQRNPGISASTGAVLLVTSAATCATYTTGTITANLTGVAS